MKNLNTLLNRITVLTNTIESQYPELYRFLDENPMTLPLGPHPQVDKKALEGYLERLQQLLEHHLETHKIVPIWSVRPRNSNGTKPIYLSAYPVRKNK